MRYRKGNADFGNLGAGASFEDQLSSKASDALVKQGEKAASGEGKGGCGGDMCGKSAAASKAAQKTMGPPAQPVPPEQLAAICADKSPAGQAACEAAKKKNQNVEAQNAQRKAIIENFVKSAIGGQVTDPQQLKLGDATLKLYQGLIAKYGDGVKYMTLQQVVDKYPEDARAIVMSLSSQFPALVGKDYDTVWSMIAPTFKDMTMMDLAASIPNSTWDDVPAASGLSPTVKAAGGGLALVLALGAAYFVFAGRKKNVQTQQ